VRRACPRTTLESIFVVVVVATGRRKRSRRSRRMEKQ